MKRFAMTVLVSTAMALGAVPAGAWAQANTATQTTPKSWNYEIKDGKRVPKSNRITNADGSWREETRVGNCVTIKEGSPNGEIKITRKCD